jgi:hypothetical protein
MQNSFESENNPLETAGGKQSKEHGKLSANQTRIDAKRTKVFTSFEIDGEQGSLPFEIFKETESDNKPNLEIENVKPFSSERKKKPKRNVIQKAVCFYPNELEEIIRNASSPDLSLSNVIRETIGLPLIFSGRPKSLKNLKPLFDENDLIELDELH